jgi:protein-L-isoaspartate O-methyltransferase
LNREPLRYQPHLTALIETLEAKGVLSTPALKQAFASMPRHHFLQQVYLQQGPGPAWQMIQASAQGEEHWLAMVYEDKALVTHVDAAGRPSSSSSQPSAMGRDITRPCWRT